MAIENPCRRKHVFAGVFHQWDEDTEYYVSPDRGNIDGVGKDLVEHIFAFMQSTTGEKKDKMFELFEKWYKNEEIEARIDVRIFEERRKDTVVAKLDLGQFAIGLEDVLREKILKECE